MESPQCYKFVYMIPALFLIHETFLFEYIDTFQSHVSCYATILY